MKRKYKAAIVGGGFSGLVACDRLSLALGGENVALFEKNDRLGKKILATGNGRGNITNAKLSSENYHSVSGADVNGIIRKYDNLSLVRYFASLGIATEEEDGRIYPSGFQASAVQDALRDRSAYLNADVFCSSEVKNIVKSGNGFILSGNFGEVFAEKVILCCGGKAGGHYGTDGTAFSLVSSLGHSVTALYPSLVQLKTEREKIKGLKGVKAKVKASAFVGGEKVAETEGDVLFTEYGISGNAAFFLSSYFAGEKGGEVNLEFLPEKNEKDISLFLTEKLSKLPYITRENLLTGIVNKQIGKAILSSVKDFRKTEDFAAAIARGIKNFNLKVVGSLGFDYAQVTRGGVPFSEVDKDVLESKKAKGLYIVGEMLDVDGDCGGYNLQWAFSSAAAAADDVIKLYENK